MDQDDCHTPPEKDRQMVASLGRGLSILSAFRAAEPLMSNSQISAVTGLARSSVSRLTHTLVKLGYLEYETQRGAYRLGPRVLAMGYAMRAGMTLRNVAMDHLHDLAGLVCGLAGLASLQGHGMLMVEVVRSTHAHIGNLEAGVHTPLDSTAMGRAYLASCSQHERERLVQLLVQQRGLDPAVLNSLVRRAVEEYQATGVCTAIDSWRNGNCGVAVALDLKDFGSRIVLTCGATRKQLSVPRLRDVVAPALRATAKKIEDAYEQSSRVRLR